MKQHPLDAVSLVCGVIFAGIGSLYLSGYEVGDLVTRFWPAGVILLGLAMLFSARRDEVTPLPAAAPPLRPVEPPVRATEVTTPIEPVEKTTTPIEPVEKTMTPIEPVEKSE